MKKLIITILLIFTACDSNSGNDSSNLTVLIVAFNESDTNNARNWEDYMPNYKFKYHTVSSNDTITQNKLDSADVVVVFSNHITESEKTGNALYQYVNKGGKIILGTFISYHANRSNNFGQLHNVIPLEYVGSHTQNDTLIVNTNHPLLSGIDELYMYYSGADQLLSSNATGITKFKNGNYFAAETKMNGKILYVSAFPTEPSHRTDLYTGDNLNNRNSFYRLWANAVRYIYNGKSSASDFEIPNEEETNTPNTKMIYNTLDENLLLPIDAN